MKQMKKYHNKRYTRAGFSTLLQAGACMLLILILNCIASSNFAHAAESINISIDNSNLNLNLLPTSNDGSFAISPDSNISVSSTYTNGYTLSIVSSTGNTNLTNNSNSSNGSNDATFSSLTSAIDQTTFSDSSNTEYNSKWGYKPSKIYNVSTDQSIDNTNFRPLPNTTPEIIDKTSSANATANTYTLSFGARANSSLPIGTYNSDSFIIAAIPNIIPLTINYDANGGYFGDNTSTTTNVVKYDATSETTGETTTETVTKYSHTSNISDAGVQNGDYGNSVSTNDVVKIDGATSLHVKITYATESTNYDWAVIWAGNYPSYTAASNYSSGITCGGAGPKLGDTTKTTKECDITGDTVTFGFKSDGSVTNYGYYAVITADVTVSTTTTTYSKTVIDGTYKTPTNSNSQLSFLGWSESQDGNGAVYADESEISSNLPLVNGDTVTLYAIWRAPLGQCTDAATCMQTMVSCPADGITATDARDGKTYTVKQINGQCWMTKDLDLAGRTTLTPELSNVTSNYSLPASSTSGFSNNSVAYVYNSNNTACGNESPCYSYYSYVAATAGSNPSSGDATSDICPKGWKLPNSSEYTSLISIYTTGTSLSAAPFYGSYAGVYLDNSFYEGAQTGYYWSSTAVDSNNASRMGFTSSSSIVSYSDVKRAGFTIRCVKKTSYTIRFNANGGSGTMANQSATSGVATTLDTNTFTAPADKPHFAGWNTKADGSGTSYANGASVTDLAPANGSITLYAQWQQAIYIQDFTKAMCQSQASTNNFTVVDKRDGNDYTVRYINGNCWITQNLRYLGDTGSAAGTMTIGNNNSNVSNKDITLYSLDSSNAGNFNPYSSRCDSTNGYNNACVYDSDSETTGVWYNYYAASGGTISGSSNSTAAANDICPSGWHLPSGPNTTSGTDYNKLVGNTTSGWQNPTAGLTAFGAVAGGYYYSGSLGGTGNGYWWSATAYDATGRYYLRYDSSDGQFLGGGGSIRYDGYFVRCVRSS